MHQAVVAASATIGAGEHRDAGNVAAEYVGIADEAVSRVHAEIYWHPTGAWLRDLDSRNGTFIESLRIGDAQLYHGARVHVGRTIVHVENADPTQVPLWPEPEFGELIGQSTRMRELFMRLARIAESDAPVLILGETGSGKELVARAIHAASDRASREFAVLDCSSLTPSVLQSELFGHVKGAFTGADRDRAGIFEMAHRGTVFLDEIGDLPLDQQSSLLRVLSDNSVKRVGESRYHTFDVRVLAATHRDLPRMVNAKTFREDLYFRLRGITVTVPPLRDRRDDIPLLAARFMGHPIDAGLEAQLVAQSWPGNVRELRNAIEHTRVFGTLEETMPAPARLDRTGLPSMDDLRAMPLVLARNAIVAAFERDYIAGLVERHGRGAAAEIARHADVDRSMVYRLMRKYLPR